MFSGAVKLADLDDFINPSQSCVKPLMTPNQPSHAIQLQYDDADIPKHFSQINASAQKTAKITLNDCLACSGCVTSAETILIEAQSLQTLMSTLEETEPQKRKKVIVASIAMQSVASIGARMFPGDTGHALLKTWKWIQFVLKNKFAVNYVFDASFAWDIALLEARKEFIERHKAGDVPVLCGECPGWVCYAEKTQHQTLHYISKVRSPQQILGLLVKKYMTTKLEGIVEDDIFHFAVAPCFDKKLEASRERDFGHDVDLVLSTGELFELLETIEYREEKDVEEDEFGFSNIGADKVKRTGLYSMGSGGYAEHMFRYTAATVYGKKIDTQEPLPWKFNKKNPDLQEVELEVRGKIVLRVAKAYGFRNIQNLVRKLKLSSGKKYDYVEVMACPSGCLNGGGQLKWDKYSVKGDRELKERVEGVFNVIDSLEVCGVGDGEVGRLYEYVCGMLLTELHAVGGDETVGLGIKW